MRLIGWLLLMALLVFTFACSTVNSRINEKRADYASYPPEVQEEIKQGEIDSGFTEDMVYMAKGKPTERSEKVHSGKVIEIWKYELPGTAQPVGSPNSNDSMSSPYGFPTVGPGPMQPSPVYYNHSYFTIEFEDGKVRQWH